MDSKIFSRMYGLWWRKYMKVFEVPLYCVNKCCENWSSPANCFLRYLRGKSDYPVCVRSCALYNLKRLSAPKKAPEQLNIDF